MVAYEFYLVDPKKWGKLVVGDSAEVDKIYFIQIEV